MSLMDTWTLYEHPPGTKSWTLESYKRLGVFTKADEIAALIAAITRDCDRVTGAYLCLMRGSIPPIYESDENKEGGAFTMRIPTENASKIWANMIAHLVAEELFVPGETVVPSGMIISPKRGNIIIQIWTPSKMDSTAITPVITNMLSSDVMYRSHFERI
jgi:hypothetical protein